MSYDEALKYGTAICVIKIVSGIIYLHFLNLAFYYGMKIRVAVCSLIYRKVYQNLLLTNNNIHKFKIRTFLVTSTVPESIE